MVEEEEGNENTHSNKRILGGETGLSEGEAVYPGKLGMFVIDKWTGECDSCKHLSKDAGFIVIGDWVSTSWQGRSL